MTLHPIAQDSTPLAAERIEAVRRTLGRDLVILGHHYQHDQVIRHVDLVGDSLELARRIPDLTARNIVFCGVHFMAETAAVLANPRQSVFLPVTTARCFMAEMAPVDLAARIMDRLGSTGRRIIPLTYVNSSADLKALCGRLGGSVCTSANARTMLDWALSRGDHVLFLPDRNLAINTARDLGLVAADIRLLDIRGGGKRVDPGRDLMARLLVWPGLCAAHARFKPVRVEEIRRTRPGALIVAHPECHPDLVRMADACGSTSFIIDFVAKAPSGAVIFVATESNLVFRLAARYAGCKSVLPLSPSFCSGMGATTDDHLAALLTNLHRASPVRVVEDVKGPAALALERMLAVCAK